MTSPVASPAADYDPGHLFTDLEWAKVQQWADAAAAGDLVALGLPDQTVYRVTLGAELGVAVLDMPAKYHGGPQTPTLQVIHSAETPLQVGYAVAIGKMFAAGPAAGTSATKMVDPATVVRMLPLTVEAYHVGPVCNFDSAGYEQAGYARFTRAEWTTAAGLDQIEVLAAELAADGLKYGIPDRHLTDAQLAAWHANGRRLQDGGRVTHDQIHRVLGGTTHTDPMPDYPLDLLNAAVTRHRKGVNVPVLDATDLTNIKGAVRSVLNEGTGAGQPSWADTSAAVLRTVQTLVNLENQDAADHRAISAAISSVPSAVVAAIAAMPTAGLSDADRTALAQDIVAQVNAHGIDLDPAEVTAIGAALGADLTSRLAA